MCFRVACAAFACSLNDLIPLTLLGGTTFRSRTRWVHLWLPAEAFENAVSSGCTLDEHPSKLSALVFVGNVLLVASFLLLFLVAHIVVISGIEAYWLFEVGREGVALVEDSS